MIGKKLTNTPDFIIQVTCFYFVYYIMLVILLLDRRLAIQYVYNCTKIV